MRRERIPGVGLSGTYCFSLGRQRLEDYHVLDGRKPGLLREILSQESVGKMAQ